MARGPSRDDWALPEAFLAGQSGRGVASVEANRRSPSEVAPRSGVSAARTRTRWPFNVAAISYPDVVPPLVEESTRAELRSEAQRHLVVLAGRLRVRTNV
jgi:hypothetical protein